MCFSIGLHVSNSLSQNKPSLPNDKISCYFEGPYLRDFKWFFYPTEYNLLKKA
jgi:hypothetical protein